MSRYPKLPPEQYSAEQKAVVEAMSSGPRGGITTPYQPLLYAPATCEAVAGFGGHIRFGISLGDDVKEFVHLLTARFWGAQAEWWAHSRRAIKNGYDADQIDQIERGEKPKNLSDEEQILYAFCAELYLRHQVSEATYATALDHFGQAGLMEVVAICGYYTMMGMVFNVAEIPLPEGATALPPIPGLTL